MTINVTQLHIDKGVTLSPNNCPIAMACKDTVDDPSWIGVSPCRIWLRKDLYVMPPDSAANFMRAFDRGEPVQPFSFEIEL